MIDEFDESQMTNSFWENRSYLLQTIIIESSMDKILYLFFSELNQFSQIWSGLVVKWLSKLLIGYEIIRIVC